MKNNCSKDKGVYMLSQVNLWLKKRIQDDKKKGSNKNLKIKGKYAEELCKMSKKGAVK